MGVAVSQCNLGIKKGSASFELLLYRLLQNILGKDGLLLSLVDYMSVLIALLERNRSLLPGIPSTGVDALLCF